MRGIDFPAAAVYRCIVVTMYSGFDWHDWSESDYLLQNGANLANLSEEEFVRACVKECCSNTTVAEQLVQQIHAKKETGFAEDNDLYYSFTVEDNKVTIKLDDRGYEVSWTFTVVDMETPKWIPLIDYSGWAKMSPSASRLFTDQIFDRYEDAKAFNDRLIEEHSEELKTGPYDTMEPVVIPYTENTVSKEWREKNLALLSYPDFWEKYTQVIKWHTEALEKSTL